MEIIKINHSTHEQFHFDTPLVIAMGFFDGVHLGHQKVINTARKIAEQKGLPLAVITYDHKPELVYKKMDGNDKRYITLYRTKMNILEHLGVDYVFYINYSYSFQAQSPQNFVDNYLINRFNADTVVAGFDHTYGDKDADMDRLPHYADNRFSVVKVSADLSDNKKVSSTRIRRNLESGHIKTVNKLLGRPFYNEGVIVHGYARGRELGYPTINIDYDGLQMMPSIGVYVTKVKIGNEWFKGMASIGRNETFGDNNPITLEINLLNFNRNVYGENVQVKWLYKIRNQVKFTGIDNLILQMNHDKMVTEKFFENV
ncbi:riboflavin biosynthesis protein RibF [Apilactobacillus xinyiensis]|uniref:riboflavin biosynthesis protein RibF n=1 Tax=Apilactobacillus xinyiensis TaxID=2841032 RepID=UPI001C7D80A2|nr:riboflavin biosynthesis protein RibF [Apilactobacillus xinyiensis]